MPFQHAEVALWERMGGYLGDLGSALIFAVLYLTLHTNASSLLLGPPFWSSYRDYYCRLSWKMLWDYFFFWSQEMLVDILCALLAAGVFIMTNRERLLFIDQNTCFLVLSFRYQKLWKSYVKLRHLLANSPKVKQADKQKLSQREVFWTFLWLIIEHCNSGWNKAVWLPYLWKQ